MSRVLATLTEFIDEDNLPRNREEEEEEVVDASHICNLIKDNEVDHLKEIFG